MSRSFTHLRRALLGVSCAVTFGFGVSEALAKPQPAAAIPFCQSGYRLCRTCTGQYYCTTAMCTAYPCPLDEK